MYCHSMPLGGQMTITAVNLDIASLFGQIRVEIATSMSSIAAAMPELLAVLMLRRKPEPGRPDRPGSI